MSADPTTRTFYQDFLFEDLVRIKREIKIVDGNRNGPRGGVTEPFPAKLYEMIKDAQSEGQDHVISWQVHGRSFIIHDYDTFARELLPRYYKLTKLSSFKRQMNLYGFRRGIAGPDNGCYYHELFLRGRPDLAIIMRRLGVGGSHGWRPYQGEEDPDFYAYTFCPELSLGGHNIVSDVSEQSSSNSDDDYAAEQLHSFRVQNNSTDHLSTAPQIVPSKIVFRRRFEFPGPRLALQAESPSIELCNLLPFEEDFGTEVMAVMEESNDFESSAIDSMLAYEEHAFHQNFF